MAECLAISWMASTLTRTLSALATTRPMVETHAGPLRPPDEAEPAIAPEPPAGATREAAPAATTEDGPATTPEAEAEALPSRVFLVTPNDWVHLDLSGDALANARRLVDRITVGAPADQAKLKLRMAATLQGAVRDALRQGAFMAAFYSHLVEGTAVGASMVVAVRPLPRDVVQDGRVDMARAVRSVAGAVAGAVAWTFSAPSAGASTTPRASRRCWRRCCRPAAPPPAPDR